MYGDSHTNDWCNRVVHMDLRFADSTVVAGSLGLPFLHSIVIMHYPPVLRILMNFTRDLSSDRVCTAGLSTVYPRYRVQCLYCVFYTVRHTPAPLQPLGLLLELKIERSEVLGEERWLGVCARVCVRARLCLAVLSASLCVLRVERGVVHGPRPLALSAFREREQRPRSASIPHAQHAGVIATQTQRQ